MTRLAEWAAGGRLVAWLGFVFGSVVSVLANVMDARLPPAGAGASWTPSIEAQLAAAVWPLSLLLAVEAVARVRWAKGWVWVAARFGGAGAVALFSAWISYWHIRDVLMAWRYEESSAAVGPFVVDGLMVITGFALLSIARSADRPADQHLDAAGTPAGTGGTDVDQDDDPDADAPDDDDTAERPGETFDERAARLIAAGYGRTRLIRTLKIPERQARELLTTMKNGSAE